MANKRKNKGKKRNSGRASGHFCWSCCSRLPNEKFSGRGHGNHLCKTCQQLGKEELEFRSQRNNLQSCITWEGIIPNKRRKTFNTFLQGDSPRLRAIAEEMAEEDRQERLWMNELQEEEQAAEDEDFE